MNTYFWIATLFGITIAFWLIGYDPLFFQMMDKYGEFNINALADMIQTGLASWDGILFIVGGLVTGYLLGGGSTSVLISFALASVLVKLFILPTDIINSSGLPTPVSLLMTTFFNITAYLVVINFIREG